MKSKLTIAALVFFLCIISIDLSAYTKQGAFRWRNDDGNESAATWRRDQNVNDSLTSMNNIRLRVGLYNDQPSTSNAVSVALFYSTDNSNFTQITTDGSSNHWKLSASDNFADGDITTQHLSNQYPKDGGFIYESSASFSVQLVGQTSKEFEFCISPTINATSRAYYFKIRRTDNNDIEGYVTIPILFYVILPTAESATAIGITSATLNGTIQPEGISTTAYFLYGTTSGTYDSLEADQSPLNGSSPTAITKTLSGLAGGTTYYYRVAKSNANGYFRSSEGSFTTLPYEPLTVFTGAATEATSLLATLNGTVNANGSTARVRFLRGTTSGTYTDSIMASPSSVSGASDTDVSGTVSGLSPSTVYYYCIATVANSDSIYSRSNEKEFITYSSETGNALKFDGSNDFVNIPYSATLNPSTFTYEIWARVDGGSSTFRCPLSSRYWNGGSDFYGVNFYATADNKWEFSWGAGVGAGNWKYIQGSAVEIGEWAHLAATYNGTNMKFYVNGVLQKDTALAYAPTTFVALLLGSNQTGFNFNGTIDEVRVWNIARTEAEIQDNMNTPFTESQSGLVGYWQMNEASGTIAHNLAGNDNGSLNSFAFDETSGWISSDNPLPIELVTFTATSKRLNTELKWNTATEINNYGFEVERAIDNGQLILDNSHAERSEASSTWSKVGFVEGNGTTNAPKEYTFTDKVQKAGKYSYRLKQIDRDGKFSYSQVVEVTVGSVPKVFTLEQNYPNPFNPGTTIGFTLQESGVTSLKIYDAIGREVATLVNEHLEAGVYHQKTFDASKLSSGIYFARLASTGKIQMRKMILMK